MRTRRQVVVVVITVVAAAVAAGLVRQAAGWLPGAATLAAVAVVGGLIARYLTIRQLDHDRRISDRSSQP